MQPPARSRALRRLHARRATLSPAELLRQLAFGGDPLALVPLAHEAWCVEALLVRPALLHWRVCELIAAEFARMPRATPWSAWLRDKARAATDALRHEDPLDWRAVRSEPDAFEQAVASCFGIEDADAPRLIVRFHALALDERRVLHALLPRTLFGLPPTTRSERRGARHAREDARRGLELLRQLVAQLRYAKG